MNLIAFPRRTDREPARGFYSPRDAARLARIPRHRLDAWRRERIIAPTVHAIDEDGNDEWGYTFEAVVYLRLIRMLRDSEVPLHRAVEGLLTLREQFGPPGRDWGNARILFQGGQVFTYHKDAKELRTASTAKRAGRNQGAIGIVLFGDDFEGMAERSDALLIPAQYRRYIEVDPEARSGAPIILGTTIRTSLIDKLFSVGYSTKRIRDAYPVLTSQQISVAHRFERFLDAEAA